MKALPFKLSKLAAGVGSVLWWMAYAPQLQAQPLQITVPIPLATTWPDYGRIATEQLETRVRAWRDAHPEIAETWRRTTYEGRAEGGPLSSNLPRNVSAATGRPLTDADVDAMVQACRGGSTCDCAYCIEQQREACEQSAREFDASVARCKAAGCANAPDGPGPHYCGSNGELPAGFAYADGKVVDLRAKPKRVRVRAKPLTAADIAPGALYVPKRGNDKTPHLLILLVDWVRSEVVYRQDGKITQTPTTVSIADFLALAARRVNA